MKIKLTLLLLCFCPSVFSEEYQLIHDKDHPDYVSINLKRYSDYFIRKNTISSKGGNKQILELKLKIVDENDDWIILLNTTLDNPNDNNYQSYNRGYETDIHGYIIDKKKLEFVTYGASYGIVKEFRNNDRVSGVSEGTGRLTLLEK